MMATFRISPIMISPFKLILSGKIQPKARNLPPGMLFRSRTDFNEFLHRFPLLPLTRSAKL